MAYYMTFTVVSKSDNKIIEEYLFNRGVTTKEEIDEVTTLAVEKIKADIRANGCDGPCWIYPKLINFRELTKSIKKFKFMDYSSRDPYKPSFREASKPAWHNIRRTSQTCFHYN